MCGADEATRIKSAAFRIVRGPLRHGTRTLRLRNQAHSLGYVILGASSNTLDDFTVLSATLLVAVSSGRLDHLAYSRAGAFASASASSGASAYSAPYNFENVHNGDGSYRFSYDANGISAHESGAPRAAGSEGPAVTSEGGYSFRTPDGQQVSLTYTADENGFHPTGSHIPTPPPIPAEILRSIEFNRQNPGGDGAYNPGRNYNY
ncbi:pupal cuticle protein 20-like [Hyposmocoma kahamanoa]|uniref:pupal cuticle protein 20-like n=1 Tax=Hyposmocoma kahamanoa TaxID=1477025 RepID=UPI000E6D9566|nr:pupal cuticle protein 20-like [Hyposmocoma kahamanoa]